ncbi:MAG: sulfurtransferase TusA family protein [candidate division FCPU426 bacterium]
MATVQMNLTKLRCPQPILKITAKSIEMKPGDVLEATADCPTFENDVRTWCEKVGKALIFLQKNADGVFHCKIQF